MKNLLFISALVFQYQCYSPSVYLRTFIPLTLDPPLHSQICPSIGQLTSDQFVEFYDHDAQRSNTLTVINKSKNEVYFSKEEMFNAKDIARIPEALNFLESYNKACGVAYPFRKEMKFYQNYENKEKYISELRNNRQPLATRITELEIQIQPLQSRLDSLNLKLRGKIPVSCMLVGDIIKSDKNGVIIFGSSIPNSSEPMNEKVFCNQCNLEIDEVLQSEFLTPSGFRPAKVRLDSVFYLKESTIKNAYGRDVPMYHFSRTSNVSKDIQKNISERNELIKAWKPIEVELKEKKIELNRIDEQIQAFDKLPQIEK